MKRRPGADGPGACQSWRLSRQSGPVGAIRRLFALEDLVWAVWLLVLAPAKGELFLGGGRATIFLLLAGGGFWLAALVGERGATRAREGWVLFLSLAICTIMIDVGLKQIGAEFPWRQVNTAVPVLLGVVLAVQHKRRGGGTWLTLPRWLRRALGWPFIMVLADNFGGLLGAMVEPSQLGGQDDGLGSQFLMLAFSFGLVMPVLYAFTVVTPRLLLFAEESPRFAVWLPRYLWAIASAWFGAAIIGPLFDD